MCGPLLTWRRRHGLSSPAVASAYNCIYFASSNRPADTSNRGPNNKQYITPAVGACSSCHYSNHQQQEEDATRGADFCIWLWVHGLRARPCSWVQDKAPGRGQGKVPWKRGSVDLEQSLPGSEGFCAVQICHHILYCRTGQFAEMQCCLVLVVGPYGTSQIVSLLLGPNWVQILLFSWCIRIAPTASKQSAPIRRDRTNRDPCRPALQCSRKCEAELYNSANQC